MNTEDNKDLDSRNEDNDAFPTEWMWWLHTKNADFSSHISADNQLALWHILSINEFYSDRDSSRCSGETKQRDEYDHEPVMSFTLGPSAYTPVK
jgi:hypothetical protein